jgi:hypothetical protein
MAPPPFNAEWNAQAAVPFLYASDECPAPPRMLRGQVAPGQELEVAMDDPAGEPLSMVDNLAKISPNGSKETSTFDHQSAAESGGDAASPWRAKGGK